MDIAESFRAAWVFEAGWHGDELLPTALARAAARVLAVDAAGLSLMEDAHRVPVGASSAEAAEAERWQFTLGEGPCFASVQDSEVVVADDPTLHRRWEALREQLHRTSPFRCVVAVPLVVRDRPIGALDLYFTGPAPGAGFDPAAAQAVAALITASLLGAERGAWEDGREPEWISTGSARRRHDVWIALGMVNTALSLSTPDSLALLRARAYANEQTVDDLAADIVSGRLPAQSLPAPEDADLAAASLFGSFLRRTHLSRPSDLPDIVVEEAWRGLGATEVVMSLVNHEFTALVPVPTRRSPSRPPQPLDGSMAGRAFTTTTSVFADAEPVAHQSMRRMWVPVLDGTDRLGVLEMTLPAPNGFLDADRVAVCERYAHLVAQTVVSKSMYSDLFDQVQRTRTPSVGSQLMRAMLPPLVYATDGLVISAMLEPAYDNGGDAFDYADNGDTLHLAIFDGMGHGLAASTVTAVALAAYRHARSTGLDLPATYAAMDRAVLDMFSGERHVTAVVAELDTSTGRLSWVSAGHPPPLLVRDAKVVKALTAPASFPLGWDVEGVGTVTTEALEPGDAVLLYTDGLIETRLPERPLLGVEGLARFLENESAAGRPAPETLRRMRRAVLEHQDGVLQDDATALLVEWRRGTEELLLPETVR
ncbi:GAF domain-containing SpoIIE family protein phosphatase [Kineococcus sp. SYSU DK003]|uniref:GAF domain-containing SpoIIE family protein phosphatase n=1 Tax=Kineococcus sp. SYSU DK003 TaxID=3383124 RepID=UPI003D7D2C32